MSNAVKLRIAIQDLIQEHVDKFALSDEDVIGALRVALSYEEVNFSFRCMQNYVKKVEK